MRDPGRRDFLHRTAAAMALASLPTALRAAPASDAARRHMRYYRGAVDFGGFLAKEVTPVNDFFLNTYSASQPQLDAQHYRLHIGGRVARPVSIGLDDLYELRDRRDYVTLECIGNRIGGGAIGNALWEGVTLSHLLERVRPHGEASRVALIGADGYADSITSALARSGEVFLAWAMNGAPLSRGHGYPLRAIVPGRYALKSVKWLTHVELVDDSFRGYWQQRGWSDDARVALKAQILLPMDGKVLPPMHYVVGGFAFGFAGATSVEIAIDDVPWRKAHLHNSLSPWSWTLWRYDWQAPHGGNRIITARAVDAGGGVQERGTWWQRLSGGTYPAGARGWHEVVVTVATEAQRPDK